MRVPALATVRILREEVRKTRRAFRQSPYFPGALRHAAARRALRDLLGELRLIDSATRGDAHDLGRGEAIAGGAA